MTTAILEDIPNEEEEIDELIDVRLTRDLRTALASIDRESARFLVDAYYQAQKMRIARRGQQRAVLQDTDDAAIGILGWLGDREAFIESQIRAALKGWAEAHEASTWAMSIVGIGPVLAAGLRAHVDPQYCNTAGKLWRFAGLDPTLVWGTGEKRPWNARLKVLCYKIGESFIKVQNHPQDIYGHIYAERKVQEIERNEAGLFAEQAAGILERRKYSKDTIARAAYTSGKLPPAHIHARARRYAVKLFLAHYQHVAYEVEFGEAPPKPYVITHLGHANYIAPPWWPMK